FTLAKSHISDFVGSYIRLSDFRGSEKQAPKTLEAINNPECGWFFNAKPDEFKKIPGSPIAFWLPKSLLNSFDKGVKLSNVAKPIVGLQTGDNERFIRFWFEISNGLIGFNVSDLKDENNLNTKWFPYTKGGEFRK